MGLISGELANATVERRTSDPARSHEGVGPTQTTNRQVMDAMEAIVKIAASIDEIPTVEETDAMLDELRRRPRDSATIKMIDDLLEFRTLLGAAFVRTRAE
jgi:hypothetical protein